LVPDPEDVPEAAPNDIEAANHAAQTIKDVTKSITLSLVFSDCARGEAVDEETPDEEAARRETTEQLTTALEDLDIASRQLVQYLYFDRLTTEQAGAKLGIDKSNVTRRHKKVLAQLSERLAPSG
ncbi:MAG: sigma-70 family RNA polymerase sigma factor, partial [Planctomycetota bacterium]